MFFVKHSKFIKGNMGIWCLQNRYKIILSCSKPKEFPLINQ